MPIHLGGLVLLLSATGCGDASPSAARSAWCDAVEGGVAAAVAMREPTTDRQVIAAQVRAVFRVREDAPPDFAAERELDGKADVVRSECGDELADRWSEAFGGAELEPMLPTVPPTREHPLELVDSGMPFQVTGSPVRVTVQLACDARQLSAALEGPETRTVEEVWVDEEKLDTSVLLPDDLTPGRYRIVLSVGDGENEYGRPCPAETARSEPFEVRARSSLDATRDW
jgi:hypothetical protein